MPGKRKTGYWTTGLAYLCMVSCIMCIMLCGLLAGCGEETGGAETQEPVSRDFFAMDTYMTVTAYGDQAEQATEAAEEEVYRLDAMLSAGSADSEIGRLNADGSGTLSEETAGLVKRGLEFYDATEHRFDIAIYPVMEAWGFTDKNYRVPSKDELESLLALTDADEVSLDEETGQVAFGKDHMAIDLGGIAKGYTSSRIVEIYREMGVTSGLVNLGGNVQVLGTKPDGSKWRVAIQDPKSASGGDENAQETQYMGVLEAEDVAAITSGAYERNFTKGGRFYHHIIDPATGEPADSGLQSVTIVSNDGTLADALSTSLFIMGKEQAIQYWRAHSDEFGCILLDEDDELFVSENIADSFHSDNYPVTVFE